jgi:FKBP-type peptidyl-prolyl cis-trans isomerase
VQFTEPELPGMIRSLRPLFAAAALAVLAGCLDGPSEPTPICPRVDIPAVAGDTVTTASGLRYIEIRAGSAAAAQAADTVSVHYTGYLTNGTRFDTSRGRGVAEFPLPRLIPGFQQGVTGMQVGGERRLIIPPQLGYGGVPQACIPANSTLIFDVELLGVRGR